LAPPSPKHTHPHARTQTRTHTRTHAHAQNTCTAPPHANAFHCTRLPHRTPSHLHTTSHPHHPLRDHTPRRWRGCHRPVVNNRNRVLRLPRDRASWRHQPVLTLAAPACAHSLAQASHTAGDSRAHVPSAATASVLQLAAATPPRGTVYQLRQHHHLHASAPDPIVGSHRMP